MQRPEKFAVQAELELAKAEMNGLCAHLFSIASGSSHTSLPPCRKALDTFQSGNQPITRLRL